jgi:outer membrane protein OmpA-like peptidoglycan-associated protein
MIRALTGTMIRVVMHRPRRELFLLLFCWVTIGGFASGLYAQLPEKETRSPSRIIIGGTYSSNLSRTHIDAYSGSTFCGTFTNGNGSKFGLQALYELPINSAFGLLGGISFHDLSSAFTTTPFNIEHTFDVTAGDTTRINRERRYNVSMSAIGVQLGTAFHPIERIAISGTLGFAFLPSPTYIQSEALLTQNAVYLENLRSTRTVASGDFSANAFLLSLALSAGYDLPISSVVSFRPYLEAYIPITSAATIEGQSYKTYSFSGGASLVIALPVSEPEAPKPEPMKPESKKTPEPIAQAKPPEPQPAALHLAVRAVGLTDNDQEVSQPIVTIENILVTDVSPTLAYLFFEDGNSGISQRYHQLANSAEVKSFSMKDFYKLDALGINHELLNILGKRLQEYPDATITVTGTRSLHSSGDSVSSDIALERAQNIAQYLQTVWSIRPSRIRVRSRALPEMNSDDATSSGQAENRRVEINASTRQLLAPVETKRLEQTATPPRIKFYQDIFSANGVKSNKIIIRQGGRVLETIDGLSGDSRHEWLWNITQGDALNSKDSITWTMEVADSAGGSAAVSGSIRIKPQERTVTRATIDTTNADKLLERFHLLLFDYSSTSELGKNADDILSRIATAVTPDATVTLIGHTDMTGDPAFNEKLSYDRASKASILLSNKLRFLGRTTPSFDLEARGSKDRLFDNSVPEGRMLSRTVRVTVERKLK